MAKKTYMKDGKKYEVIEVDANTIVSRPIAKGSSKTTKKKAAKK